MKSKIYKRGILLLLFLVGMQSMVKAQAVMDPVFTLPDTSLVFTMENFYYLIRKYHPVVKQVELLSDVARQEIRLARGNFDPKIEAQLLQKNFKGTEYYDIFNAELKFPTASPIEPKIGVDRNQGRYLNPERYISGEFDYKQFYAGIAIPLGRGLLTDDRRMALRQAVLFQQLTEAEQVSLINKLLLDAAKDYWEWFYAYYNYRLFNQSVQIANDIFRRVKANADLGEAAPVDTVQAKITLQERQVDQQEALLAFRNTGIQLSNYLWDSLGNPSALPLRWAPSLESKPGQFSAATLNELMQLARENHPELQKVRIKLEQLELDRRLAIENMKPRLDVSYYLLNQPFDPEMNSNFNARDNYKFGLDFSLPIFLRKERAKLAMTKLKINNTRYEQTITERQIVNGIESIYNTLQNFQVVLGQRISMVDSYDRLVQAELLNVESGESDLFKLNFQIEKLIEAQTKLLKLIADQEKQKATLYWAAGVRNLNY